MNLQDNSQPSARNAPGPKPSSKLYSMFALLQGKIFKGSFETTSGVHQFEFHPANASLANGKLQLSGTIMIGRKKQDGVKAVLIATQGGLTAAPAQISSRHPGGLSTEYTGTAGFVGALFFKLSPLSKERLGVSCDLSATQLNVRLFATSELERNLQVTISDIVYQLDTPGDTLNNGIAHLNQLLNS
jgi:hypothetical protein